MSMCLGCFAPSGEFLPYLKTYIAETAPRDNEIGKLATYSLNLIEKGDVMRRKYAPSADEISSIRVNI